ncbi:unnamed protein product [Linum trigynum]|uniref:Uncharacterized protein n=1 Tax=Linum trigynum TaxID=586398 RepID=A0AAV2D762_9ROSI
MMRHSIPNLRSAISALPTPPTALVVDIFGTKTFPLGDELGLLKYAFDTTTAWFLATAVYRLENPARGTLLSLEIICEVSLFFSISAAGVAQNRRNQHCLRRAYDRQQ